MSPSQLRDQDSLAQARQNGKSGSPDSENLVDGPLEQTIAVEPVMPVAEALDSVTARQFSLGVPGFRQSQVVIPEVGRQARLKMASEKWLRPGDVRPLGEAFSPPAVVLGHRVKLRQVKGDQPRRTVDLG